MSMIDTEGASELIGRAHDPLEKERVIQAIKNKMAVQSFSAVRTLLNVHRGRYEALVASEAAMRDLGIEDPTGGRVPKDEKSYSILKRMAQATLKYLDELNELADEAIELAAKEHRNG